MLILNEKTKNYSIAQSLHSEMAHGIAIQDDITVRSYPLLFSELQLVQAQTKKAKNLWNKIVAKYHYLGYTGTVGRYIRYFICDCSNLSPENIEITTTFHEFINSYTYKEIDEILALKKAEDPTKHNFADMPKSQLGAYLRFGWRFKENNARQQNNLKIKDLFSPIIGCISAGSATYSCNQRDYLLGFNRLHKKERDKYLKYVANNWRFLILGKWPNLASHLLSKFSKLIQKDWMIRYNNPLIAIESFVMKNRFDCTSYIANHWIKIGETKGYSKSGSITKNSLSMYGHGEKKDIYIKLLFKFPTNGNMILQKIKKQNRYIMQRIGKGEKIISILDEITQNEV